MGDKKDDSSSTTSTIYNVGLTGMTGCPRVRITAFPDPSLGRTYNPMQENAPVLDLDDPKVSPAVTIQIQVFEGERNEKITVPAPPPAKAPMGTSLSKNAVPAPPTVTSPKGFSAEQLKRKEEYLTKLEKKLKDEQDMLAIGRSELHTDIQRHHNLMRASIAEVNSMIETEQQAFIDSVINQLESFKLPSLKRLVPTEAAEAMIEQAKALEAECYGLCP